MCLKLNQHCKLLKKCHILNFKFVHGLFTSFEQSSMHCKCGMFFSVCIYGLGMANRFVIRDHQITASSSYPRAHLQPHMGRLNNPWGSWCVKRKHPGPHYMQIDLGKYKNIIY